MAGETDLDKLLALMQPKLLDGEYVFCTLNDASLADAVALRPLATYLEEEGLSVLLEKSQAEQAGLQFNSTFRGITLSVHSSLDAVGFTAAVSTKLSGNGIPSNVIAAHYHDHVFVPAERAEYALQLLTEFEQ
ncbi:MAG: ACT domain-containing protein [Pseudomonadales bacterium]|nr:ACT domain-containing protein [Pseudomonadales bacterium]